MDGTKIKESWTCHYCHDSLEQVVVVPDQNSLVEQLHSYGVKPDVPSKPLQRPTICELPEGCEDPGDSWMCTCMKYFSPNGTMHDLNVKVYLNYEKYVESMLGSKKEEQIYVIPKEDNTEAVVDEIKNSTLDCEDIIQVLMANENERSFDSTSMSEEETLSGSDQHVTAPNSPNRGDATHEPVYCPDYTNNSVADQYRDTFSLLEIDENAYDSDVPSCISQFANFHDYMSDPDLNSIRSYDSRTPRLESEAEASSTTYYDLDTLVNQTCKEQGIRNIDDFTGDSDIGSTATDFQRALEEMELASQASNSSRGRKKSNINSDVDMLVDNMLKLRQNRIENPLENSTALLNKKQPETVCLSSDSENDLDEGEKKSKRKRKLPRHRDVAVIDLEAMGLTEEKDNYVRLGEVIECESCIQNVSDREDEWLEVKALRHCFRKTLQARIVRREHEAICNDQILMEEIRKGEDELKSLWEKKAALEALERECTTNPIEKNLLLFGHPRKIHGTPLMWNESIISPYKLALLEDEIYLPDEWSDDLPFKGYYHVKQLNKNNHISKVLNKFSEPIDGQMELGLKEAKTFINHLRDESDLSASIGSHAAQHCQNCKIPSALVSKQNAWDKPSSEIHTRKCVQTPVGMGLTLPQSHTCGAKSNYCNERNTKRGPPESSQFPNENVPGSAEVSNQRSEADSLFYEM